MKRILINRKTLFGLIVAVQLMIFGGNIVSGTLQAEGATINSTKIDLYAMDDVYSEKLSIPASYQQSFQLKVTGTGKSSFRVIEGDSVEVSSNGVVTPAAEIYYWNGNVGSTQSSGAAGERKTIEYSFKKSVIKAQNGTDSFRVEVTVHDYAYVYAQKVMDDYFNKGIHPGMGISEKLNTIAAFPAQYDYDESYSSAQSMIIMGGGDCWASSDAIYYLCKKAGLQCRIRDASGEAGAGSGHRNVVVKADGQTYVLDAGYVGKAPRGYSVQILEKLFSYEKYSENTIMVTGYDGADYNVVIPEEIDGYMVEVIANNAFAWNDDLQSVVVPEGVVGIGMDSFAFCTNLKNVSLPSTLKEIASCAFLNCSSLESITIPENVEKIYSEAIKQCYKLKTVTFLGDKLEYIGAAAFQDAAIKRITLPANVKAFDGFPFTSCQELEWVDVHPKNKDFKSVDGVLFDKSGKILICYPSGKNSDSYTIPSGVTTISDSAFDMPNYLKSVYVPESVRELKEGAVCFGTTFNSIYFRGSAPKINKHSFHVLFSAFEYISGTVYYPINGEGWTSIINNIDIDDLEWKGYCINHSWDAWKTTKKATVASTGKKVRICNICGEKESISIPKLIPTLKVGKNTVKLSQTKSISFEVSFTSGDKITVKSSNKKIATATYKNGKITIKAKKKPGKAIITVTTATGKSAKIKVTVPKAKTTKITCKKVSVKKGKKVTLKPKVAPSYSDDKITYKSANKKIATVTSKGVVKGVKKGTTTITVKSGKKNVKVKVTVK